MQYVINDANNLSDLDISSINHDSHLHINNLGAIKAILEHDHIAWFRHLRIHNTSLQYKGNIDNNALYEIIKQQNFDSISYNKSNCLVKSLTRDNIIQNYTPLKFNKYFSNFNDIFMFDIKNDYYDSLSFKEHLALHERVQLLIDFIYLNTSFMMKINLPKTSHYNHILYRHHNHEIYAIIKNRFSLTDNELYYLNIISISGSSKEVAKATGKSPRTIEKMIATLCKKININNKFSLQLFAKILASKTEIAHSTSPVSLKIAEEMI